MILAKRIKQLQTSQTIALNTRAIELKAQGKDVINLTIGEPDFDTPEFIKEAAIQAIHDGKTKYTPADGIPVLKQAIIDKYIKDHQLSYELSQVIVTAGAKMAIYLLCQALLNTGDEVIIPVPYWVSYAEIVKLSEGLPVFIKTTIDRHYKITPEQLEKTITDKTRLFFLNNPNNPSGQIYSEEELKALAEILLKHPKIIIMSDEIYDHLVWSNAPVKNIVHICPELSNRTIVVNGVSKTYAMTGWRIGYALGPQEIIFAMKKLQSQIATCPVSISEEAALAAITGSQDSIAIMQKTYQERQEFMFQELNKIPGIQTLLSPATFYSFANISGLIKRSPNIHSDVELCEFLLNEALIAVVPGFAFGDHSAIRFSVTVDIPRLKEVFNRLHNML